MGTKRPTIQRHHITYGGLKDQPPELVVKIYKGEHMLITKLGWRTNISRGFIKALKKWIEENEEDAIDLDAEQQPQP